MSEALARAAAGSLSVDIEGKKYILAPLTMVDFATIEQEYIRRKPDPIRKVAEYKDALCDSDYQRLLDKAYGEATAANQATPVEVSEWMDTKEGLAYSIWLSLLKTYPQIEYEFIDKVFQRMSDEVIEKMIADRDQSSGVDNRGNLTGRSFVPEKVSESAPGSFGITESKSPEEKSEEPQAGEPSTEP